MPNSAFQFRINNLPFDTGYRKTKYNKLPQKLPFLLVYNKSLGIITQGLTRKAKEFLKKYYESGGYGSTPLGEGTFGKRRALFIMEYIEKSLKENHKNISDLSFLEIGSSYGYLLSLLKTKKAKEVLGLEPGKEGILGAKKYKVKVIRDFFPTKLLVKKYDYILSHCVLEHIENPLGALIEMKKAINKKGGIVFVAAPDSERKMKVGDISILTHQHVSYFTKKSLTLLLKMSGLSNIKVVSSNNTAMLIGWGKSSVTKKIDDSNTFINDNLLRIFSKNVNKNLKTLRSKIKNFEYKHKQKQIGLYGDYGILRCLLKFKGEPRMFDGDSAKWGKYVVGSSKPIESPKNLLTNPVNVLFIAPIDYDQEIREDLKKIGLNDKITQIVSLKEIYEKNSRFKYIVGSSTPR